MVMHGIVYPWERFPTAISGPSRLETAPTGGVFFAYVRKE
jgi:hypothetical protein